MPKPVSVFYFCHYLLNKIPIALSSFCNKTKYYGSYREEKGTDITVICFRLMWLECSIMWASEEEVEETL